MINQIFNGDIFIKKNPNDSDAFNNNGLAYSDSRRYDSAIECIFDDISFETKLEELLKMYACFQRSSSAAAAAAASEYAEICSRPEIIFIEHSFCLIKFSKLTKMISSYSDLFATFSLKLDQLASTTTNKSIQIVSSNHFFPFLILRL